MLRAGLLALLVFAPLPFGSVQPWAVLAIELGAAALALAALPVLWGEAGALTGRARGLLAAAVVLVGIGLGQLLPLPAGPVRALAGPTAEARAAVAAVLPELNFGSTITLSAPATLDATLRMAAYALIGLVAALAMRTRRDRRTLAIALATIGGLQALYGCAEYLSGNQHIFRYAKRYFLDEATGTFINRNHFAGYLAMSLPLALALVLGRDRPGGDPAGGWRQRILRIAAPEGRAALLGAAAAMAMWAGVLLSSSRAGLACALAATVLMLPGFSRRRVLWLAALTLLVPLGWLLFAEVRAPGERFADLARDLSTIGGRWPTWRATAEMAVAYPWLGVGLGTFAAALPLFDTGAHDVTYLHAHNEWLQVLAEGGPLALAAVLAVAVWLAWRLVASLRQRDPSLGERCLLASFAAIALFSVTDFCLRIPANAVLLAVLLGTWAGVGDRRVAGIRRLGRGPGSEEADETRHDPRGTRRATAVAVALLVPLFTWAALATWRAAENLEADADATVRDGLAVLGDYELPPAERLAGYRSRLREAEALLARSLLAEPAQARALSKLAAIRWDLDPPVSDAERRRFLDLIALASQMAPRVPEVQQRLGTLLLRMGIDDEALAYFRRALDGRPALANEIVPMLRDQGLAVGTVVERLPARGDVLRWVVKSYDGPADLLSILDALEAALPGGDWKAVAAYGEACLGVDQAARLERVLAALEPSGAAQTEAERRLQRSRAAERLGRPEAAMDHGREAAAREPDGLRYLNHLGGTALRLGHADEAVGAFRRALAVHVLLDGDARGRARLYRQIGQAEERAGRADRAFDAYRQALTLDPAEPVAARRIAEMEAAAGLR